MKTKVFGILALIFVAVFALSGIVSAAIQIESVKLDGDTLNNVGINTIMDVERGNEFEVKINMVSDVDVTGAQAEAYLRGYDHEDLVQDITDVFDMNANVTYVKKLTLKFPDRLDATNFDLRVRVEGATGSGIDTTYSLQISAPRHELEVKDVVLSPDTSVEAGRALLASVRVKNYGQKDEQDVKVTVSIPALGVSASDYIDEIAAEDSEQSEELYMRVPENAKAGTYTVVADITFNDGDDKITKTTTIRVNGAEAGSYTPAIPSTPSADTRVVISVGSQRQDVTAGKGGVIYPIIISNPGTSAKTASVAVDAASQWATTSITPSNVVVIQPGETKAVYVYVAVNAGASAGEHMFSVSINGLSDMPQQIAFTANVLAGQADVKDLKTMLEIGLVAIAALIVIIGLIIAFTKGKGKNQESSETYY